MEYEVNNYISVLLLVDYDISEINNAINLLTNYGYLKQAKLISESNYVKIKDKSYLYSDELIKSNMYLIKGDRIKSLKID
ncbi:Uncharacterised protein [Rodentibacter pneumotropicus]|uniref:Uncharacterized protein n=1 Tax=Rodentibacter pneumotropicus TaxID=758 RepID=A0A448MIZ6_9PAST|nr:Uncharacterised protein [Rodentibacter pneumotropicus]